MQHRLPDWVDPLTLADKGRTFRGRIPLTRLERLQDRLSDTQGELEVELSFGRNADGIRYLAGHVEGCLPLICERCLGRMSWDVKLDFNLALLESEGLIDRIPERYEPLLIEAGEIRPVEVIEDELLLTLPMYPKHAEEQDCQLLQATEAADEPATEEPRENPFAALASLKRKE